MLKKYTISNQHQKSNFRSTLDNKKQKINENMPTFIYNPVSGSGYVGLQTGCQTGG